MNLVLPLGPDALFTLHIKRMSEQHPLSAPFRPLLINLAAICLLDIEPYQQNWNQYDAVRALGEAKKFTWLLLDIALDGGRDAKAAVIRNLSNSARGSGVEGIGYCCTSRLC